MREAQHPRLPDHSVSCFVQRFVLMLTRKSRFFKDGVSYKFNRARTVADFTDFVTKSYYLQDGVEKATVVA